MPPNALTLGDRFIRSTNIGLLFSVCDDVGRVGSSSRREADLLLKSERKRNRKKTYEMQNMMKLTHS